MNRRTAFVTAAAVTGTVLAGTTAVAANIGILNSAESSPIGDLSATAQLAPATTVAEPQVVDVFIEDPAPTTPPATLPPTTVAETPSETTQQFSVADAGTLSVVRTETGLRLGDVTPVADWSWESSQSSSTDLVVTFTSNGRTYVFYASVAADGTIAARVDEPIVKTVTVPAPSSGGSSSSSGGSSSGGSSASSSSSSGGGGYEDDHEDDHEDHHEDDHSEHEGGEDDD